MPAPWSCKKLTANLRTRPGLHTQVAGTMHDGGGGASAFKLETAYQGSHPKGPHTTHYSSAEYSEGGGGMSEMLQRAEEEGDYDVGVVLVRPILDPTFAGQLLSLPTEVVSNVSGVSPGPLHQAMECVLLASLAHVFVCLLTSPWTTNPNAHRLLRSAAPHPSQARLADAWDAYRHGLTFHLKRVRFSCSLLWEECGLC